jgi:hypothetical protein
MRKTLPNLIELKACAYDDLQLFLQRILQIFPVLESRLEVEQFLVQVPFGLAQMVTRETLIAAGRKQPEKAFFAALARAKRWAWNFFLDDLIEYPEDPVSNRAERFVVTYRKTSLLPRKLKTGTYAKIYGPSLPALLEWLRTILPTETPTTKTFATTGGEEVC